MQQHEGYRRITQEDAFSIIGLHDKNESTYYLDNMIIEVDSEGLNITYKGSTKSATPDQSIHTSDPFKYSHDGVDYLIVNDGGELAVYEEEQLVGS